MLVTRDQLAQYQLPDDYYFETRNGTTVKARNFYFSEHPELLLAGIHCAIGSDLNGWELELYNGVNWTVVNPSQNYLLTITNDGLTAMNNVAAGGLKLNISGVKFISETVVPNPTVPLINWTDEDFFAAGNGRFVFTCGTKGSVHSDIRSILSWRFNSSTGALQYILTLPPEGTGATSDAAEEEWMIGTIGLYIKSPYNNTDDILFAVGRLTNQITKTATNTEIMGNTIKLYLNTTLSNLGSVSNLSVLQSDEHSIPEVPNESFLENPSDLTQLPYNCYLVDNLNGTGVPALAVPRADKDHQVVTSPTWAYFQPSENFTQVKESDFDQTVMNYMFVYWDSAAKKYKKAEGRTDYDPTTPNTKTPIGIRIGNSIAFTGNIINNTVTYQYTLEKVAGGKNYQVGDELLIRLTKPVPGTTKTVTILTFRVKVNSVDGTSGSVIDWTTLGPTNGDVSIDGSSTVVTTPVQINNVPSEYSPYSQLPHNGTGVTFNVMQTYLGSSVWNLSGAINQPVYCGNGDNAGLPVTTETDAFLGWCTAANAIQLNLDVRQEASKTKFGTTRYAENDMVVNTNNYSQVKDQRAVTPDILYANYLRINRPSYNTSGSGNSLSNPIFIDTFVKFNQPVLGRHTNSPYSDPSTNPRVTDSNIDFYGLAFSAWYQDIAEYYMSDAHYDAGTLVSIGEGEAEMTIARTTANGVISDRPGFILGKPIDSPLQQFVALTGRTPVLFDGHCLPKFGDKIYLSKYVHGMASTIKNGPCLGRIIQKNFGNSRRIECIVHLAFE